MNQDNLWQPSAWWAHRAGNWKDVTWSPKPDKGMEV